MIDVIVTKFNEIAKNCIIRNAKELSVDKANVQLVFKLGMSGEAEYLIYKEYKPIKALKFLEVLGVRLDMYGYSLYVPNFIKGALNRFCDEHKIGRDKVRVLFNLSQSGNLIGWLYNDSQYVKQFEVASLFEASDMINIQ